MAVELKVPNLGESIREAFITKWLKSPGDPVAADEPVAELESDKATVELPAPSAGVMGPVLKQAGASAAVGEVIGSIDDSAKGGAAKPAKKPKDEKPAAPKAAAPQPAAETQPRVEPSKPAAEPKSQTHAEAPQVEDKPAAEAAPQALQPPQPVPAATGESVDDTDGSTFIMPAAKRLLNEAGLKASEVTASGPGGRLLKEDVERHIEAKRRELAAAKRAPAPTAAKASEEREDKAVPMTPMRRTIARRLVEAQQNAALLTTFNEVDMTAVNELRGRYKDAFQERHGIKLGFMSFFVKAVTDSLKLFPQINAEVRGEEIIFHNYFDIGIAIGGGGKGLVVPVIRNADKMSFAQIELAIADFGKRAKENKIELDELRGGTFTISNGGFYGSLLSTPIVNPPQSGILGMHAIQDRPVVRNGQIVIRPMMYIALTYDHRIVDGREAVTFLKRVKEGVEDPARMLMEV